MTTSLSDLKLHGSGKVREIYEDRDELLCSALLHDIGKLAVSNQVLDKPGKLDADEFARIVLHAV